MYNISGKEKKILHIQKTDEGSKNLFNKYKHATAV